MGRGRLAGAGAAVEARTRSPIGSRPALRARVGPAACFPPPWSAGYRDAVACSSSLRLALARSFPLAALLLPLAACPADDGTGETGSMIATLGDSGPVTAATADDTASSGGTAGPAAECNLGDDPWTFVDALDMPRMRGVGEEDRTCNPVTADTVALEVQLSVPESVPLDPAGSVRVLLFEADPNVADASADCVGGLCESLAGSALRWTFEVPNDQPSFTYYIVVDVDTDGPDVDGCTLRETDFVSFAPGQGTLMVPMTADGCV